MKNYNLTLALIPLSEKEHLKKSIDLEKLGCIETNPWLHKKSLSTKAIKNYKCVIDCIFKIIEENISPEAFATIQINDNVFCIDKNNAEKILKVTSNFIENYDLTIKKELASLIYKYEIKTTSEILKEVNSHIKTLNDYLKLSNENFCLVIFCSHLEMAIY